MDGRGCPWLVCTEPSSISKLGKGGRQKVTLAVSAPVDRQDQRRQGVSVNSRHRHAGEKFRLSFLAIGVHEPLLSSASEHMEDVQCERLYVIF